MALRIVLLGPPGAGKGTQAKRLAASAKVAHVASGDLFRKHQAEGTELGNLAKTYMEKGELVPDQVTVQMVLERIKERDAEIGYVLDGFPRTMEQAEALDRALAEQGEAIDWAPLIEVDKTELRARLGGRWVCTDCQTPYHEHAAPPRQKGACDVCGGTLAQRPDDRPEAVEKRLEVYDSQTAPLIYYYERQGKLRRVNGAQPVDVVAGVLLLAIA